MSDLIRREDAVAAAETIENAALSRAERARNVEADLVASSEASSANMVAYAIRAIPIAVGTCANCAEWQQYPFDEIERGTCESGEIDSGDGSPWTKPDFFCAAWKAKEPQA